MAVVNIRICKLHFDYHKLNDQNISYFRFGRCFKYYINPEGYEYTKINFQTPSLPDLSLIYKLN